MRTRHRRRRVSRKVSILRRRRVRRARVSARIRKMRGVRRVHHRSRGSRRLSVLLNPRRRRRRYRSRRRNPFRIRHTIIRVRRRRSRRNPFRLPSMGGIGGMFRGLLNKEQAIMGVGAASGFLGGQFIDHKLGAWKKADGSFVMPGLAGDPKTAAVVMAAYKITGTFVAAQLLRRVAPNFAKGFALGGFAGALADAFYALNPTSYNKLTGLGEYFVSGGPTAMRGVSALPPGYMGINTFQKVRTMNGALDNPGAFAKSAW